MQVLFNSPNLSVIDIPCQVRPGDKPFEEVHERHSLSFIRKGGFGCRALSSDHELTAGGFFVGFPGDSFICTHEHHDLPDECLSFQFSSELIEEIGADRTAWRTVAIAPLPALAVLGTLAQASAEGRAAWSVDETGLLVASRFVELTRGAARPPVTVSARERRHCVEAALWLEDNAGLPITLEQAARAVGLSPFHFLRLFRRVTGTTPYRFVLACRLRRAARLLIDRDLSVTAVALEAGFEDLSNFERTFKRAAGLSPGRFRKHANRKILQERAATLAPV